MNRRRQVRRRAFGFRRVRRLTVLATTVAAGAVFGAIAGHGSSTKKVATKPVVVKRATVKKATVKKKTAQHAVKRTLTVQTTTSTPTTSSAAPAATSGGS